jgi:hypothetical protein
MTEEGGGMYKPLRMLALTIVIVLGVSLYVLYTWVYFSLLERIPFLLDTDGRKVAIPIAFIAVFCCVFTFISVFSWAIHFEYLYFIDGFRRIGIVLSLLCIFYTFYKSLIFFGDIDIVNIMLSSLASVTATILTGILVRVLDWISAGFDKSR